MLNLGLRYVEQRVKLWVAAGWPATPSRMGPGRVPGIRMRISASRDFYKQHFIGRGGLRNNLWIETSRVTEFV